jgi:putative molybdopterin biosynthesis protein
MTRSIAEGKADTGLALEGLARIYNLGFIPLTRERYDLVIPEAVMITEPMQALLSWLESEPAKEAISSLGGYEVQETGNTWELNAV